MKILRNVQKCRPGNPVIICSPSLYPPGLPGPSGPPDSPGSVAIISTVQRYFYITNLDIQAPEMILATEYTNDNGEPVSEFPNLGQNGYSNLYINAMIQTADTSTVSTTTLTIPGGDVLDPATPIIVEFVVT